MSDKKTLPVNEDADLVEANGYQVLAPIAVKRIKRHFGKDPM